MPPIVKILYPYLVAFVTAISLLGPVVAPFNSLLSPVVSGDITRIIGAAGALHLFLLQSPLAPYFAAKARENAVKVAASMIAFVLILSVAACSLFKSGTTTTTVVGDVGQLAACVLQHIESDADPTVESVAAECSPIAAADVVAILAALEAVPTTDAGTPKVSAAGLAKAHKARALYLSAVH